MYQDVNAAWPNILRATTEVGTDTGVMYTPPGITMTEYRPGGGTPSQCTFRDGILVRRFELHNRSGGAATVGLGFRLSPAHWKIGRLAADLTTYTDLTETAQAKGAITLGVAGANQTGFLVTADQPIGWISMRCTTAETNDGGATVVDHTANYSAVGNTWVAVSTSASTDNLTTSNAVYAAGMLNFVWQPLRAVEGITNIAGVPEGWYGISVTAAHREANDVAPIITGVEVGTMLLCKDLANNGIYANETIEYKNYAADAVVAYFSTAAAQNRVYCECKPVG